MKKESLNRRLEEGARQGERGTATVTAVLIMGLLAVFAAASLSRVTTEAIVMGNDYSNTQAFYAAQASLELMSRNFNNVFDVQINPTDSDINRIQTSMPAIANFNFNQQVIRSGSSDNLLIEDGPFSGLVSLRTPWRLQSVATYTSGAQVQLTRTFYNHQIPIFQFGIYYEDDMELFPGPNFNFGGRVHSNRHIFLAAGSNLYFKSRVTAAGEVVRDLARSGKSLTDGTWTGSVWVANASGVNKELLTTKGSVIGGPDVSNSDPNMPNGSINTNWSVDSAAFNGNLLARQRPLRLPLQIGSDDDPIEMIKRGKDTDNAVLRDSRYFNKPGIRVSLSDTQAKLPGGTGGVRLDMKDSADTTDTSPAGTRGYLPPKMNDNYQATRFNGHRVYTGTSYDSNPRQTWIKIELVTLDSDLAPVATDITKEMLMLGFTEKTTVGTTVGDDRAVFKLQRYAIPGPPIKVVPSKVNNSELPTAGPAIFTSLNDPRNGASTNVYSYNWTGNAATSYSYVATSRLDSVVGPDKWRVNNAANASAEATPNDTNEDSTGENNNFEVEVTLSGTRYRIVPFPIKFYDTREGLYHEDLGTTKWTSRYTTGTTSSRVPVNGVLSLVDIDMFNLGRLLAGTWNGQFPSNTNLPDNSLSSDDFPTNGGAGWIVYVSDRRGDKDDDGEFDMENIYIPIDDPNSDTLQPGEDVNGSGALNIDYVWEARRYYGQTESGVDVSSIETDVAAVNGLSNGGNGWQVYADRYFRRGVRIVNGERLSGSTTVGSVTANMPGTLNRGFSISSENGMYVLGNLNANGVSVGPTSSAPTQPENYTGSEVPFSVVGDAVTLLSTNWQDGKSFRNPFQTQLRTGAETTVRTALLMGDAISTETKSGVPSAGGKDQDLNGGVHNFPRFLESWGSRLNYCGSLINLFNSRNNNSQFKCCNGTTYGAPTRNWVFNTAFLDINRLPPGTPFFQYVQMTGFRQTIRQLQ